jgi:hypothetical protein
MEAAVAARSPQVSSWGGGSGGLGGEDEDSGDLLAGVESDPGLHVAGLVAQRDVDDRVVAGLYTEILEQVLARANALRAILATLELHTLIAKLRTWLARRAALPMSIGLRIPAR